MWLPQQLEAQAPTLAKLGLGLDVRSLSDPLGYPLGAVVSLGGCSASFVSADGLVATNHHCVTGYLQYNSTPADNLLENGYLARTRADEKSVGPTARLYVTQSFTEVTDFVRQGGCKDAALEAKRDLRCGTALERLKRDDERQRLIEKRIAAAVARCEEKPNVRCEVASYFGDGQYLLIEKLEIKDVRLVYAPHEGIGNFGGEIDNWRWPRHGGDFAFLRAYVGKDGKPAPHAADNVPYRPKFHLRLAKQPLRAGDLVFVAGYPGATYRLSTAEETAEAVEWAYPRRLGMFADYLALIAKLGKDDPDVALKARPMERGLANYQTYTKGSLEGLTRGGALEARRKRDAALASFIAADPEREKKYGDVFGRLGKVFAERKSRRELEASLDELWRMVSLLRSASIIVRMAEERPKADKDRDPDYQKRNWERYVEDQQQLEKRYHPKLDQALLELALTRVSKLADERARGKIFRAFFGKDSASADDISKLVLDLYASTQLADTKHRIELLKNAKTAELAASKDRLMRVAVALRPLFRAKEQRSDEEAGVLTLIRPRYVAALREQTPTPIAPDANGTLRVTFGTVKGYRPRPDAKEHEPFTRLPEVAAKATGKKPFHAPARLVELARRGGGGPWADSALGTVPVDFLSDCDITGGNSGSPTLNGNGELVGLAFDGNYEAMASDWLFQPSITRSIHVDLRYMAWVMDAVDRADHLLTEMGAAPALP